jgi:hypothetical protein
MKSPALKDLFFLHKLLYRLSRKGFEDRLWPFYGL